MYTLNTVKQEVSLFQNFFQDPGYLTPTPPIRVKSCGLRIPGENTINDVPEDVKIWLGKKYRQHFYLLFQQT